MTTLFFDESGSTGPDLLNKDTPFYACSALRITEARAIELKKIHFPNKTSELKFGEMQSGRNFFASMALVKTLLDEQALRVTIVDKHYALCAKLFEWVAEPSLGQQIDAYGNGYMPKLVNTFYLASKILQPEILDRVLRAFQNTVNNRDEDQLKLLISCLREFSGRLSEFADGYLLPALHQDGMTLFEDDGISEGLLGVLITAAWTNILRWGTSFKDGSPLEIVYDRHSVMEKEKALWDQVTNANLQMQSNNLEYALQNPVTTQLADSKSNIGLQIADVVAGFSAFAALGQRQNQTGSTQPSTTRTNGTQAFELLTADQFREFGPTIWIVPDVPQSFSGWKINQ